MRKILYIIYISLIITTVSTSLEGCSNVGCTENRNSIPLAGFYSYETKEPITANFLEIGGVGAPSDSLLLTGGTSASQVYLPFRAVAQQTKFFVSYIAESDNDASLPDTLTFDYESRPYFDSEDCGAMYHYYITTFNYTRHRIDSVAVTDSLITNLDRQTIEIYFSTPNNDNTSDNEN